MAQWVDIAAQSDIKIGEFTVAEADDNYYIIFNFQGRYYAVKDCCPHDGGILSNGRLENSEIICPRHGARFNIITGNVTAPPATENLQTFKTRAINNRIEIKI